MNRHGQTIISSSRPASQRIHRRVGLSLATRAGVAWTEGYSSEDYQAGPIGRFELLAAELRIAELERELAVACEASRTDPLTGALNRRGFEDACRSEVARAARRGVGFVLAHIDIDDFKRLNDAYGHQAGDVGGIAIAAQRPCIVPIGMHGLGRIALVADRGRHQSAQCCSSVEFLQYHPLAIGQFQQLAVQY